MKARIVNNASGETLTYEGHPIPYKLNGISGYISVEVTGKCLFFYVYDGDVMYDEIGENGEMKMQTIQTVCQHGTEADVFRLASLLRAEHENAKEAETIRKAAEQLANEINGKAWH